ncbi:PH domain-containing protein [Salinimonas chungwhensis]|uniref:PH domain-containing protein n=1 Tax=Salinimonas chungwhensis TaxID=265425 RepID=UPI00036F9DD4|nr:PH domain-containing protein [Salinimonas chungwhensis]
MNEQDQWEFENRRINVSALPDMMDVELTQISPRYRVVNLSITAAVVIILVAILSFLRFQTFMVVPFNLNAFYPAIVTGVCSLGGLNLIYHFFADKKIKYCLREQDLVMQQGLFLRKIACQPILRIQHIELKRGPVERSVDLATLQVFSAGGSLHTFEIPGLRLNDAQRIRQYILSHKELNAK